VARAEIYQHAKFRLDLCNRLATVHQRHRQDRQTDRTEQVKQRSDSIERTVLQTVTQKVIPLACKLLIRNLPKFLATTVDGTARHSILVY